MNVRKTNKRKAISPVLATVILIAITLVAGVAIAGFAFGLFGSLSSSANVQIIAETCTPTTNGQATGDGGCILSATNTGTAPATVSACSLYGGAEVLSATPAIAAGTTSAAPVTFTCEGGVAFTAGAAISGQVVLSNGATLTFSSVVT